MGRACNSSPRRFQTPTSNRIDSSLAQAPGNPTEGDTSATSYIFVTQEEGRISAGLHGQSDKHGF
jgi:hypothetical protein